MFYLGLLPFEEFLLDITLNLFLDKKINQNPMIDQLGASKGQQDNCTIM